MIALSYRQDLLPQVLRNSPQGPMLPLFFGFLLLFMGIKSHGATAEQRGLEVAKICQRANQGFGGELTQSEMTLIGQNKKQVKRELLIKTKEVKGDGHRSIITFVKPLDVRGTKLLTWGHRKKSDDQWLYLPYLKRVKRINSRVRTGAFMGSEFTYEDLGSHEIEKYKYKLIKEIKQGKRALWILERYPLDQRSGYQKHVVWMDKEYKNPIKIDYYDRKGKLLKTATFKEYGKNRQWWQAKTTHMLNHQTRKESILVAKSRKLGQDFSDEEFESEGLKE